PRDAWQIGRSLMVLARDERVLISGKKKNEFVELGSCAGADRIALRKEDIVIVNGPGRVIAGVANGQLILDPTARLDSDPPSGGPWRIDGMQFSPPRGGTLEWDDRCGFQPLRLRSPRNNDPQGMLLVTQSLVINLDPGVAKSVGKKR
ncbi:MAG: hypothetical protein H0W83_02725, partial [Planctomycetes bacterium]|nr:hypothetical protein [Planctomycetota bacterium]